MPQNVGKLLGVLRMKKSCGEVLLGMRVNDQLDQIYSQSQLSVNVGNNFSDFPHYFCFCVSTENARRTWTRIHEIDSLFQIF